MKSTDGLCKLIFLFELLNLPRIAFVVRSLAFDFANILVLICFSF